MNKNTILAKDDVMKYLRDISHEKTGCETYKSWCIRQLMEIAQELQLETIKKREFDSRISAVNYVIGYLVGMGWVDE